MRDLKKDKSSEEIMEEQRKMKKVAEFIVKRKVEKEKNREKAKK
ncbi:hypothetical protein [Tepidibacter formicigenes]|jgi:hypothetical protein|uniref:Uncharacterized protein n=1 Tax=Tepidibacter formicigenes DSM 15518 TaxID=1123349 RepID=A0A1M6TN17_9FIRM|nr:hypothetical protein [Tepidibacter formicigenes]SHK58442.1 hypothetical protein SAMN02744037_02641 [Tepidibacter formicigenes DSM 15518]